MEEKKSVEKTSGPKRFIAPLQSTGRVGKSTVCEMILSWADYAGIQWAALDTDDEHRTLSSRFENVKHLAQAARDEEAFRSILPHMSEKPLTLVDYPAQATEFLLTSIEKFRVVELLEEGNARMTVLLFPADDQTALTSLAKTVKTLGDRVDYLLVKNPARYKTEQWDGSDAQNHLTSLGAKTINFPTLTTATMEELADLSRKEGRFLSIAEGVSKMSNAARFETEGWINVVFCQLQEVSAFLIPDCSLIKKRIEGVSVPNPVATVNPLDPLNF